MLEAFRTLKAAWPMLSRAILSGLLFRPQCKLVEADPDILCAFDVEAPIGGGTVMTLQCLSVAMPCGAGRARPGRDVRPPLR